MSSSMGLVAWPESPARRVVASASLILASITFWLSWWLMPDAATNDAQQILEAVGSHRGEVQDSALVQLLSSALFAPALVYFGAASGGRGAATIYAGATLLAVGAMGMAADAVYHQAAARMAAPDVDAAAVLPALERMQTEDIKSLVPLLLAFFAGALVFCAGFARAGVLPRAVPIALGLAAVATVIAAALAPQLGVGRQWVVLVFFAVVAAALASVGVIGLATPGRLGGAAQRTGA